MFESRGAHLAFSAQAASPSAGPAGDLLEVGPGADEAMRRQDEYQQARVLVPDGAHLQLSGTKPTKLEEEEDLKLTQLVWSKVVAGASPEQCEAQVPVDAFRVRRLLAHWVESKTLQIPAAAPTPSAPLASARSLRDPPPGEPGLPRRCTTLPRHAS